MKKSYTKNIITKNFIRTLSGITPVAILTKSFPCPGKCIYCPTEKGIPKSYLSSEPAVMRAIANNFDPQKQIKSRINAYQATGHPTDKIEIIIITSNWATLPLAYKKQYILAIYNSLNKLSNKNYKETKDLNRAKKFNETTSYRCIGMSIETRPDSINENEILLLRKFGVTRVEMGVQTIDDKVLKIIKRGHTRQEVIVATKLLKDSGFKVCYHLMPNLPSSTPKKDFQIIKEIFNNPDFQPDQLKIYPCILVPGTPLEDWYKKGKWKPYPDNQIIKLLAKIKSEIIPPHVRIMRLWRDIPMGNVAAGSVRSDMRLLIADYLKQHKKYCQCIRCREIRDYPKSLKLSLNRIDYQASDGQEIFLQFIDSQNRIYAMLRLRIPFKPFINILKNSAIIRELHVFGPSRGIKKELLTEGKYVQHQGLGKKLLKKAEEIAKKEFKLKRITVISGVGVRDYYRQLGFTLEKEYMVKLI